MSDKLSALLLKQFSKKEASNLFDIVVGKADVRRTIGQGRTQSKIQKPKFQKPKNDLRPHRAGFKIQFY